MLKKLFSRFFIVAMTILLLFLVEVGVTVGLGYFLTYLIILLINEQFAASWGILIVQAISGIVVFITAIHAANRDMVPETKIPWILCIIALGLFGVAIYTTFSSHRPSRKNHKRAVQIYENARQFEQGGVSRSRLDAEMRRW